MRRAACFAACLIALAAPAAAGPKQFKTPSGNIGCYYQYLHGDFLTCLRYKPTVQAVFLSDDGANAGVPETWGRELVGENVPVLRYGQTRRLGEITCTSEKTGLSCEGHGHGFSVSRRGIDTY